MKKKIYPTQLVMFFLLWLPAFVFEISLRLVPRIIYTTQPIVFFFIRYGFALLFFFGWFISFAYSSYHQPEQTMGVLLLYFGLSVLLVSFQYSGYADLYFPTIGATLAGMFSYAPLRGFTQSLINSSFPYELYVIFTLTALFFLAWLVGLVAGRKKSSYNTRQKK